METSGATGKPYQLCRRLVYIQGKRVYNHPTRNRYLMCFDSYRNDIAEWYDLELVPLPREVRK